MAIIPYSTLNITDTDTASVPNSRLLSGSAKFRYQLETRNLYAPDTEYPLQNEMYASNVVDSISTIIAGITPFKSYNLKNTVYGRLITNPTPLTDIGLMMLGKQMTLNFMSNLAQQTFPVIKVTNLFDGKKDTKLFTKNKDLKITRKEDSTNFENFIDRLFFRTMPTPHPTKEYPFTKNPSNSDFIKNSGYAQLEFLYRSVNRNIYKQDSSDTVFYDYADKVDAPILPRSALIGKDTMPVKRYFNFGNITFNPYLSININSDSKPEESANKNMVYAMNGIEETSMSPASSEQKTASSEYAPTKDFVRTNFGQSKALGSIITDDFNKDSQNEWINDRTEFAGDDVKTNLVWGRDGIDESVTNEIAQLRGDEAVIGTDNFGTVKGVNPFNIRTGLLEYTRNLLNASEGQFIDTTRKAFLINKRLVGFNGSGLWKANDSKYMGDRGLKTGIRQHSVIDQYDRFAKAIRFNGNELYEGNPNSVIYKSVIPRIHPTLDGETGQKVLNNKNLMFSIENLAVKVIDAGSYGIMDDEFGSPLPKCEVGPFGGRTMWFPPYNIEINETANAVFEKTVMVGRNEPMYNYMNSERGANISFTLLIDYPPQLKGAKYKGDKQRAIAEFFAFGGEGDSMIPPLGNNKRPIPVIPDYVPPTTTNPPNLPDSDTMILVFPNDVPRIKSGINNVVDDVKTVVDKIWKDWEYNIKKGFISKADISDAGFNDGVLYIPPESLEEYTDASGATRYRFAAGFDPASISQYDSVDINDQFGQSKLNYELHRVFNDPENRPLYSVYVYGGASQLYTEKITTDTVKGQSYNELLGKRRADAAIHLVKRRLAKMFGENNGIEVTYNPDIPDGSVGDTRSGAQGATAAGIPLSETVAERRAEIIIKKNATKPKPKPVVLVGEDKRGVTLAIEDEEAKKTADREALIGAEDCVLNQRGVDENGILHGFQSISKNYFYPVFHSQTPEDFHKRLTFLHQCTRQGAAIRYQSEVDGNGTLRARNSVFGRQPICILRIGDFFYTKIIIETLTIDYADTTWDMNPEGFGMQPMIAKITLQVKIIGGQSLKGPIDALQNAVAFNYYANSTFTDKGIYELPSRVADAQASYIAGIQTKERDELVKAYNNKVTDENNIARMKELNLIKPE